MAAIHSTGLSSKVIVIFLNKNAHVDFFDIMTKVILHVILPV